MTFATITDINQWKYLLPNILVLEGFKRPYNYYIYGNNRYVSLQLINAIKSLNVVYGSIQVDTVPTFFTAFKIKPVTTNHAWITSTTMDRFVLPLYTDLKKFLWLDCDTLITSEEIFNLENIETSDKGIAAVSTDTNLDDHIVYFSKADYLMDLAKENSSTFNAGVCLIDCDKLKSNNYVEFINNVYERSQGAYVNDEVILNLYDQSYNLLPLQYNCMTHKSFEIKNPYIVHFSGKDYKPWVEYIYKKGTYLKHYKLWEYYYLLLDDYASRQV